MARRLLASQFPRWAHLPLRPLRPGGSDHVIFRLGEAMTVRLPRGDWAAGQAQKEHLWLPRLAPHLPLAVPAPLEVGEPAFGYPWHWSVSRWLDGRTAAPGGLADAAEAAADLAAFLGALRSLPLPPSDASYALLSPAVPLRDRDRTTRAAIAAVGAAGAFDACALTAVWEAAVEAGDPDGPPVWFHGDMHNGNILTRAGQLSAVLDFGGLGVGDPVCDLVIAWTLLDPGPRAAFREALGADDAAWARGRGWALTTGLSAYTAYAATNPHVARATTHQITEALADRTP
ncbi:aminoglycoside phosphotransferase family protein [Streptomyces sp. WMMC500]|uniref:aminoglycoside phosphotransferase family protein n=1 Tax=Streptomyces sp. WMMC500 TaxID=3015154 RepID=UPI00248BBF94|nr:aminoglycoside phosphotransferase family protein [Streptomyces sp. WMMC500]WBB64567.1 aminoglycoside phosphotransferase family protein [Streptomyces sp. WMMC500]